MTTKDQFISHIRKALGRSAPLSTPPVPPVVVDDIVRLQSPADNLTDIFIENAASTGMKVTQTTSENLNTDLINLLKENNINTLTLSISRLDNLTNQITDTLQSNNIQLVDWQNDRDMKNHYNVDAGLSDVHAAIAETGTLVCRSSPAHGRGHTLVPPIHVAIVRASDIVPDMLDVLPAYKEVSPEQLPSATALITGPSKTADIEGILITGVHGPGKVFLLVINNI